MYKVAYYARVSTEEEGKLNAIENQIRMLEDFINSNLEWKLVGSYVDIGKSGTTTKSRLEYNNLYSDLSTDKFDIVIVKDLSRLNRNPLDYYKFIDNLVKNKKRLYLYIDNKFYESDDSLINGIKAILASEYCRDLSKKVNAGHKQKQKEGLVITNNSMWGYRQAKGSKKLTIDEKEASYIRQVFNWYIEGKGFRLIYKLLENEEIRNRNGKPFAMTTLKRIIQNQKYKGILVSNKTHKDFDTKQINKNPESEWIIHENIIPPIVSEKVWDKANEILEAKKKKYRLEDKETIAGYFKGKHLYSGKIFCGECGEAFWHTIHGEKKLWMCKEYRSFGMKKENKTHGCLNVKVYTTELDKFVKQVIYDFVQNKDTAIKNVINVLNLSLNDNNDYKDTNKGKNEIVKLKNRKQNMIEMMADQLITKDEYIKSKKIVDEKIENLEAEIKSIDKRKIDIKTKTERLKEMELILNMELESPEYVTDEIIEELLDKIVVKSENEFDIYKWIKI
ncbi:recombinase family protein [Clostridium estertheticum]|uniref:recombinase family protein n=1 Tax=Clostridium estertheticum TaxID=238834 RepID=UPI001C0E7174|nr:recombinase family protein [Clostridium estertheticum]MBU3175931.1 recombinase family protein [Clostridium estertheticum]